MAAGYTSSSQLANLNGAIMRPIIIKYNTNLEAMYAKSPYISGDTGSIKFVSKCFLSADD